jgi:hypothetical protein
MKRATLPSIHALVALLAFCLCACDAILGLEDYEVGSASLSPDTNDTTQVCQGEERSCEGPTPLVCSDGEWLAQAPCALACKGGRCTECEVGQRCTDGSVETCVDGFWQISRTCALVCEAGACLDSCTESRTQCNGTRLERCEGGAYVDQGECTPACVSTALGDACAGECRPGTTRCVLDAAGNPTNEAQSCTDDAVWSATTTPCSGGCVEGVCAAAPLVEPGCAAANQLVTFDALFRQVNQDLAGENAADQLFYRYISLTNRFTAGECVDALGRDREGLTKMLNMLSTDTRIAVPTPVNADQTLYRIDLREFGWDERVDVVDRSGNIVPFADKWEAIAAHNPYAVEFVGDAADDAKADTGTPIPLMFADQMMDVAIIGNLYYAIIGVDVNQPLSDFIGNDLDVDLVGNLFDEESIRAGTTKSRVSRQDRLVQRDEIGNYAGVLWQSFDLEDGTGASSSIFADPLGVVAGSSEAIFTLPNGMLGFVIADENGAIVEDSDILLDTNQKNFRAITSASCSNCHAQGFIPVVDEVREVVLREAVQRGLTRDQVDQLSSLYVSSQEFARQVEEDSQDFFKVALQGASLPTEGADPVSSVFRRFESDMRLEDAAGDLGIRPDELRTNLALLAPSVSALANGTLDRDDFTAVFVDSLCRLSTRLANKPDAAACNAARIP